MSAIKLELNHKGAETLREFSESFPIAIQNISDSTNKLIQVYKSVSEDLGVHEPAFAELLRIIEKAQENAVEAIRILPQKMKKTADDIDNYVSNARR